MSLFSLSLRVFVTYLYFTRLFVQVNELVVREFEGLCDLFSLYSPVPTGRWAYCQGVWGSVWPIFTLLTCSYRSMSLLSGSLRFLLHSPVHTGQWACCPGVWGSVLPIFTPLTCSYRSISLLSRSLRVCMTYFYFTHLFIQVNKLVVREFEGLYRL